MASRPRSDAATMRSNSEPVPGATDDMGARSEGLVDERRMRVVPAASDGKPDDDGEVVERERDQPHRRRPSRALPELDAAPHQVAHAPAPAFRRRSMSATSRRGVAQASRSKSDGEIVRPNSSSNAAMSSTVPSESSTPDA